MIPPSASDPVARPQHYEGATVDAMTAIASCVNAQPRMTRDGREVTPSALAWLWQAMKYLWRAFRKNGQQDLRKARQCIDYLEAEVYGREGPSR